MNGKFVAYYRVSTAKQGVSGLGLEAQKAAVSNYLNGGRWTLVGEFKEIETGTRKGNQRPALAKALAMCRVYNATLIIAKLDRLARNVKFIADLMESDVEFTAVDFPKANRLTIHILAAVAEHEAKMIADRTKAALAAAKTRGVALGGRREGVRVEDYSKLGNKVSATKRGAVAEKRALDLLPAIQAIQSEGATSLRQIAAVLNERGILTPRGSQWNPVQVQRVLAKAPLLS